MKAYELEVHFIGAPDYYYFETKKEAEAAARDIDGLPDEEAYWGSVKTTATINEIELSPDQYIEGNEIITVYRRRDIAQNTGSTFGRF